MARTASDIIAELEARGIHVRQHPHRARGAYEIWAACVPASEGFVRLSVHDTPSEAEQGLRAVLDITNAEGLAVEAEVKRRQRWS